MADETPDRELIKILAAQIAYHQDQVHKVNGRAILVFLGAAVSALSFVVKEHKKLPEVGSWLHSPTIIVVLIGGLALVCGGAAFALALAWHSSERTSAQKRLGDAIDEVLRDANRLTRHPNLFWKDQQPKWGMTANRLFFAGTIMLIVAMLLVGAATLVGG